MANQPLTGSWGKEKFEKRNVTTVYATTAKEQFNLASQEEANEMEKNKFAKFTKLKKAGQMIMSPNMSSYPLVQIDEPDLRDRYLTTQQISYGVGDSCETSKDPADYGKAMGRSGSRKEKGIAASGLLGETLNISEEPSQNTFVQRTWLYDDDKALYYKVNGRPKLENDGFGTSLKIGNEEGDADYPKDDETGLDDIRHPRKDTGLRFNPIAKTGYKIFADDEHAPEGNLRYHYKIDE